MHPITLNRILLVVAVVCFAVALLLTLGTFDGGNPSAWGYGGLLALAASFLA